jgi:hypothetical protein
MLQMPMFPLPPSGPRRLNFTVREISGWYDRRRFVRFAARLYRNDRYWAPGIISERMRALDPKRNPALTNISLGLFMAESRTLDDIVGTIAVWADDRDLAARPPRRAGAFGLFESINEEEVISSLLETAETWVREHVGGVKVLRGPMELDPIRSPGLLVDGYNRKPAALMPYNPPFYAELIETSRYAPGSELVAYQLDLSALKDPQGAGAWSRESETMAGPANHDVVVREASEEADWRTLLEDAGQESLAPTWRVGPESPEISFQDLITRLGGITAQHPAAVLLIARDRARDDVVAFAVAVPNAGEPALLACVRRLAGRWRGPSAHGRRGISRAARRAGIHLMPAIIRMDCLDRGLEELLLTELLAEAARRGYAQAEVSPVPAGELETKDRLAALGASPSKTYRIYEKRY